MAELDPDVELSALAAELADRMERGFVHSGDVADGVGDVLRRLVAYTERLAMQVDNLYEVVAELRDGAS